MAHKLNTTDEGVAAQLQYDTIALVLKMFGMMGGLFLVIAVYKRWEKRKALAKKPSRAILDDDEAASRGLEMGEMNSAAEEAAAAEEGSVSVGDAPRGGMEGVRDELTKLRMSKYAAVFEENGYDHCAHSPSRLFSCHLYLCHVRSRPS